MKNNLSTLAFSFLGAMSISQIASPVALTVICSNPTWQGMSLSELGMSDTLSTFRFVVEDDLKNAAMWLVSPNDGQEMALPFECNGQKSLDADFKCQLSDEGKLQSEFTATFMRDTENKMSFEMKISVFGFEVTPVYECV